MEWPRFNPHCKEVVVKMPRVRDYNLFQRAYCTTAILISRKPQLGLTLRLGLDFKRSGHLQIIPRKIPTFALKILSPNGFCFAKIWGFASGEESKKLPQVLFPDLVFCFQLCCQNLEKRLETVIMFKTRIDGVNMSHLKSLFLTVLNGKLVNRTRLALLMGLSCTKKCDVCFISDKKVSVILVKVTTTKIWAPITDENVGEWIFYGRWANR
jgi:hypothetical protein